MKSIATLNLEMGMLNIPMSIVSLGNGKGVSFQLTCGDCQEQIKQKRICPKCNKEIPYGELGRSIKIGNKRYMVEQEIIDQLKEADKKTEIISVLTNEKIEEQGYGTDFNMLSDKKYGLLPKASFEKQYCFLHSLLVLSGKKILIKYVTRSKSHIGLVKPFGKHLLLVQLQYAEYYRKMPDYEPVEMNKEELKLGLQLIEQFGSKEVATVKDTYAEQIGQYISGDLKMPIEKKVEKTSDMLQLLNASLVKGMKKERGVKA